ncbi:hypothetical protein ACFLXP_03425 [Chloroflexota bacterium]
MFKWLGQISAQKRGKAKHLWETEFNVVKNGLNEEQVVSFVNNLMEQHRAAQQTSTDSLRSLLKTAVTDAEQIAASIKTKAQNEAEAESVNIINNAKQQDQEIKRKARLEAKKDSDDIISVANKKAEITEVEAKQQALLFLLRAREEIEQEVREEYRRAYSRLAYSLQDLLDEGQNIEAELKSKRGRLWESRNFELKEQGSTLLDTSDEAPPLETWVARAPEEGTTVVEEKDVVEPVEATTKVEEEIVAEPEQMEEPVKKKTPKKKENPKVQLKEEIPAEPAEQVEKPIEPVNPLTQVKEETPVEQDDPSVELKEETPKQSTKEENTSNKAEDLPHEVITVDGLAIYDGEIELAIGIPVELKLVSKFYNHLQTLPDLKVLRTTGSWDRGTTIMISLDKPIPLIKQITEIPGVEVITEVAPGQSSKPGDKGTKKINLTLRESQE